MYYDGTKLLSLKDRNAGRPELYLCTTNRTAGKTTFFSRYLVNRYLKKQDKFALLYRFKNELYDVEDKFFNDIRGLFFRGREMTSKVRANGTFVELFLDGNSCGYALAINGADGVKKYSHFLNDVEVMFMDEFQSETNTYCPNEITKFRSVHTSIARGKGKQVRYVPVIMCSNAVTLLNPYYVAMGISDKITKSTKFLRGNGYVLEHGFNESAAQAQMESAFNRAFQDDKYLAYAAQNVYLNDSSVFIEKPTGNSRYLATIRYAGNDYGIFEYAESGYLYCSTKTVSNFPLKIAVTLDDHKPNYVMIKKNDLFITDFRYYFDRGAFRFKNLQCKKAVLETLSY